MGGDANKEQSTHTETLQSTSVGGHSFGFQRSHIRGSDVDLRFGIDENQLPSILQQSLGPFIQSQQITSNQVATGLNNLASAFQGGATQASGNSIGKQEQSTEDDGPTVEQSKNLVTMLGGIAAVGTIIFLSTRK